MRLEIRKGNASLLLGLVLMSLATRSGATAPPPPLPNPVLYLMGLEAFQSGRKEFTRYKFDVLNKGSYPMEMFLAAPSLPPCGSNNKASRTWVDIFDQRGKRLYGFCALGKPDDLGGIWFDLESDVVPPSYVYIELNDRQTNTRYKSNLAETTP